MELLRLISERRSVRRFRPDPVEEEKITAVLEAARQAPSWKNGQCWRFVVVKEEGLRRSLAACLPSGNPGGRALEQAPVNIAVCADPAASETWEGRDYYLVDAAIALEHLVLAAAGLGLATCWIGMFHEEKVKSVLGIPRGIRVVALTPLGYAAENPEPRPRKKLEEIVFRERWGGR